MMKRHIKQLSALATLALVVLIPTSCITDDSTYADESRLSSLTLEGAGSSTMEEYDFNLGTAPRRCATCSPRAVPTTPTSS